MNENHKSDLLPALKQVEDARLKMFLMEMKATENLHFGLMVVFAIFIFVILLLFATLIVLDIMNAPDPTDCIPQSATILSVEGETTYYKDGDAISFSYNKERCP